MARFSREEASTYPELILFLGDRFIIIISLGISSLSSYFLIGNSLFIFLSRHQLLQLYFIFYIAHNTSLFFEIILQ